MHGKQITHRLVLRSSRPGTSDTFTDSCAHSGSGLLTDSTAPKRSRPQSPPATCQRTPIPEDFHHHLMSAATSRLAEKLLASHPEMKDAYLAVGVENYMLSLKPAPVRWLLHLSGAQTDKETGVRQLKLTAEGG